MATMRVVQVPRPNGPFEIVERTLPEPGAGSVRIKVQACGICHSDSLTKEGTCRAAARSRAGRRGEAADNQQGPGNQRHTSAEHELLLALVTVVVHRVFSGMLPDRSIYRRPMGKSRRRPSQFRPTPV